MNLENKRIIVTGASSGIGRAVCIRLARAGAKVILISRREDKLRDTLSLMRGEGHQYYSFDLIKLNEIEVLVNRIVDDNGKLDGFVHCAGYGPSIPINMTTPKIFMEVMTINCGSFVEISRVFSKKKNNNGGSIVAISSVASIVGDGAKSAYCASKSALDGAVRALAVDLRPKKIRVNSIQPGWVRTGMYESYIDTLGDDAKKRFSSNIKNTVSEPEQIADLAAFLLSADAGAISGASIVANSIGI